MATLADGGRITIKGVTDEIERLHEKWKVASDSTRNDDISLVEQCLGTDAAQSLDLYEHISLGAVLRVCQSSKSMADAGRQLFNVSRLQKSSVNDSHRVKQILGKYGIVFSDIIEES